MMQAVKEFFRNWQQLLYWVFFKPTAMRKYMEQIVLEQLHEKISPRGFFIMCGHNPKLRTFLLRVLLLTFLTWFIGASVSAIATSILGFGFDFEISFLSFLVCISLSVLFILGGSYIGGIVFGIEVGCAFAMTPSIALCIAIGMRDWISVGIAIIIILLISGGVATLRIPFYLFELRSAIVAYHRAKRSNAPDLELFRSPAYFDDLLVLPHPFLSSLLVRVARNDLKAGLRHIGRIACNPFQRWAAQKAWRILLEIDRIPFFVSLDMLLSVPEPYIHYGYELKGLGHAKDRYFTTKLLLAELMFEWPKMGAAAENWPNYYLIRRMTFWLRVRSQSEFAVMASVYFHLLCAAPLIESYSSPSIEKYLALLQAAQKIGYDTTSFNKSVPPSERLLEIIFQTVTFLQHIRKWPSGEEFYQFFRLAEAGFRSKSIQQASQLRDEFTPLFEIHAPLRPQIIAVFRKLRDAAVDAGSFLTAEHELTQRDSLLKAQGVLEEARQLTIAVYEPERSLLLAVIEHWRRIFAVEGARVVEKVKVEVLPNPYVFGPALNPRDHSKLFVGRRDEFRAIEEKLHSGVSIVIWGQRRIGKSSILRHLPGHLPHDLLPVYLNLQMLMANTTGGFLRALGNEIVKELRDKLHVRSFAFRRQDSNEETQPPEGGTTNILAEALLSAAEFDREPYLSFNHLLEEVEQRLQPGQSVLLSFDEFEALEQRVNDGKIEKEIFAYLRGVTQTGRGFALMFAGLHTLEEMTREYWNPFFQSVQTIRIGYLSELDAEQLIRDPMEQFPLDYELEAVNRITEVTRSHPYLTQSLCHNLINRLNDPLHRSQKATREDVDAVLERTLESSGYYFDDYVWGWSGADEQLALSLLAEAGDDATFPVVEKHLGREAALEATRKLVAREILTERTATGELVFRFQIPLARLWVQRTKSSARILLERQRP